MEGGRMSEGVLLPQMLDQLRCCRKRIVGRVNRIVNTRSIESWLSEEKLAFVEMSNRDKLNNTISYTWLLPLATRPCKRERDETLYIYMSPTSYVDIFIRRVH